MTTPDQSFDTRVWNAVFDADPGDPDAARKRADAVAALIEDGRRWQNYDRRAAHAKAWRAHRRAARIGLSWATIPAAIAGIVLGAIQIAKNHDYAGYGPSKVPGHAAVAIRDWYGQNDLPPNLTIVSQTRSLLYGVQAWKVVYHARDGRVVCAYVWDGAQIPEEQVREGANCT